MLDKNRYNSLLDKYEQEYPNEAKNAVSWCAIGNDEIVVRMRNGDRSVYNESLNGARYIRARPDDDDPNGYIDDDKWRMRFGETLRHRMYSKGLSTKVLSEMTKIPYQTIRSYTNGNASPSGPNISRIARALGCSVSELMYFDD